jgi:glyoxalase family protein
MSQLITGIHHVTATASHAQKNIDFYTGILGMRLLKKTVNFDNSKVYHFYYGNERADIGVITFFPYPGLKRGRKGNGQLTTTSFSISPDSLDYWMNRLKKFGVLFNPPQERFQKETYIYFEDEDGIGLELVANQEDRREGFSNGVIPAQHAIKGFYGVALSLESNEKTIEVLTELLNHKFVAQEGSRIRYAANSAPGGYVDLIVLPNQLRGLNGSGTVHHLALETPSTETQKEIREKVLARNYNVTEVLDRSYFTSIYFREPGGVLFEIATTGPGFTADEDLSSLGEELKLPPWLEPERSAIEQQLDFIIIDKNKFID